MAKTAAEITNELALYECCLADLALKYVHKEVYGQQDLTCQLNKLKYAQLLHKYLSRHVTLLEAEVFTQAELEEELEKLADICGCVVCEDSADLLDDTLPTGLAEVFGID